LRLGLRIVADRDAFRARQRRDQNVDFVLLDQLLGRAHRGVRAGVRRADDGLDFPAAGLAAVRRNRKLVAAHAVFAKHGVRAFERGGYADFELVGGIGRTRCGHRGDRSRDS
jgi:hypothetical protein